MGRASKSAKPVLVGIALASISRQAVCTREASFVQQHWLHSGRKIGYQSFQCKSEHALP